MSNTLQKAIKTIKSGDRETGKRLLAQVIKAEPQNEAAWLWMTQVVDSDDHRLQCLERVLAINPDNKMAQRGLFTLQQKQTEKPKQNITKSPNLFSTILTSTKEKRVPWKVLLILAFIGSIPFTIGFLIAANIRDFSRLSGISRDLLDILCFFLLVPGGLLILPAPLIWLGTGLAGGWKLSVKKLRGRMWWIWLLFLGFIPIILWLIYMILMGLLGVWANKWAESAKPNTRRCPQCRSWVDYKATRCPKCTEHLPQTNQQTKF